jgi:hypothetical protein
MTPSERLAAVSAELSRLDDLLKTLWSDNARAHAGARRIACLHLALQISKDHDLDFSWPAGPPHPRTARLF